MLPKLLPNFIHSYVKILEFLIFKDLHESNCRAGIRTMALLGSRSILRPHYLSNKLTTTKETSFIKGQTETNKSKEMPITSVGNVVHVSHNI